MQSSGLMALWDEGDLTQVETFGNGLTAPGIGHNQPPEDPPSFAAEIAAWTQGTKAQRNRGAVPRKELTGLDRLHAHRRALVEGQARYYRAHPRADVSPGL